MKDHSIITHQAVNFAWITFKKHYRLFTAILLTIFGVWVALEILVIAGQRFGVLWWTAAHLAFLYIFAGLEVGFLQACFALYDGKEPTFFDTFGYLAFGLEFFVGQILCSLITIIGLALFILPGVYFGVRYAFLCFCQVSGEKNLGQCFQQSARLSIGNSTYLLATIVSILVFNVIGACLLGIGLFVTVPLSTLIMTAIYKQLSELNIITFQNSV